MNKFTCTLAALTLLALSLAGCEEVESDPEVIGLDDLEATVEEALADMDDVNDLAEEVDDPSTDLLEDLDVDEADESLDRVARRELIKRLIRRAAEDEECALRGILGGRYVATPELDADFDGLFRGRAFRRTRRLVATGGGTWTSNDDAPGGTLEGEYENFEGDVGLIDGEYTPEVRHDDIRLGSFDGTWAPLDGSHEGGNIGGVWHPTRDGRGVFVGYWSRCDCEPVHTDTSAE